MQQRGFSTIMLIVLVVVLASMTTFALRFVSGAQGIVTMGVQTSRVRHAAETAVEWQRYQLLNVGAPACVATNLNVPFTSGSVMATITCIPGVTQPEGGQNITPYDIKVTACWPAGPAGCPNLAPPPDYVEQQINVGAACPDAVGSDCSW